MKNPRSILITGASSGIGEALALSYAKPGVFLALSGRNKKRLEAIVEKCREKGADVKGDIVDVADMAAMRVWIEESDRYNPLQLVVANAGISGAETGGKSDEKITRDIFSVNMAGVLNTLFPAIEAMRGRQCGQIAMISSMAGFRGMPSAPAYSTSKVMVKAYGEALHGPLGKDGIGISIICPGFVESRITAKNTFKMPMIMTAEEASIKIRKGLEKNRLLIAFPWPMVLFMWLLNLLPPCWANKLLNRLPRKG